MDLNKFYLSEPWPASKLYHIFDKKDDRAICGKVMILAPTPDKCQDLRGNEVWFKGQDCKTCFRKAKLDVTGKVK